MYVAHVIFRFVLQYHRYDLILIIIIIIIAEVLILSTKNNKYFHNLDKVFA